MVDFRIQSNHAYPLHNSPGNETNRAVPIQKEEKDAAHAIRIIKTENTHPNDISFNQKIKNWWHAIKTGNLKTVCIKFDDKTYGLANTASLTKRYGNAILTKSKDGV